MANELSSLDVSDNPDLLRIAEEVEKTGERRVLRKGRRELAVIVPIAVRRSRKPRRLSESDRQAFLSSAGGWSNVDTDKLLEDIYASRDAGERPPVRL